MIDLTFYYDLKCDDRSIDGRRVSLLKGEILPPSTRNGMLTNDDHVVLITKQIRMIPVYRKRELNFRNATLFDSLDSTHPITFGSLRDLTDQSCEAKNNITFIRWSRALEKFVMMIQESSIGIACICTFIWLSTHVVENNSFKSTCYCKFKHMIIVIK
jgi:hypothetical protein